MRLATRVQAAPGCARADQSAITRTARGGCTLGQVASWRASAAQEKLRPIDKKLQYQMDKLLRAAAQLQQPGGGGGGTAAAAANTAAAGADPLSFGPNPDRLLPKVPLPRDGGGAAGATAEGGREGLAEGGDGLYRPPRNVAVSTRASSAHALAHGTEVCRVRCHADGHVVL